MNVILTGASRGIGHHTALNFCKSGVKNLVLISRNKAALLALKEECFSFSNSLINVIIIADDLLNLVKDKDSLLEKLPFTHLDLLLNNAGMLINKPFGEISTKEGKEVFDVNFHAPAQLIRILSPLLTNAEFSHVVNISSIGGFQGSSKNPGLSYYSASKAALAALTECLAAEFADSSVSFNCLALGAVQTEMLEEAFPGYKAPVSAQEMGEYIADFALTGHKYYNGQIIPVRLGNQ